MEAISRAMPRIVVTTTSDAKYFPLLRDMLTSLDAVTRAGGGAAEFDLAFIDLGVDAAQRDWLAARDAQFVTPRPHFGLTREQIPTREMAFLLRPFLPEYLPGYDIYVWIDSDIWFQSADAFEDLLRGAATKGMAIVHESERAYRLQLWLLAWTAKHFVKGYGALRGARLLTRTHVNAGLFAIAADAPHWDAWARRYAAAIKRTGKLTPHDQFALNQAIHQDRLPTAFLPPTDNWICDRGVPMWNDALGRFCAPYAPHAPISAMHLAGPGKSRDYTIARTGGGAFTARLTYGASPARVAA